MKTFVLSGLVLCLVSLPVMSQPDIVRQIRAGNNDGQTRQIKPETIYLANGHGVTINFLHSGEEVSQAWLDNPSFVVLSADGCLQGLQQNCQQRSSGASVLHLKRINDLNIPGLPKTGQSLLTVVTRFNEGKGNVYLFKIVKASKPSHLVFEITSNQSEPIVNHQLVKTFRQGVLVAYSKNYLKEGSSLDRNIQAFLGYLAQGLSVKEAGAKAALSEDVINRLQELGE